MFQIKIMYTNYLYKIYYFKNKRKLKSVLFEH